MDLIFDIQDSLERQEYSISEDTVFVLHERGRIRRISSLKVRDRVIRHILCDDIFMPLIRDKIIYDNGASIEGRGLAFSRKRFEAHLHRYVRQYGTNEGYALFGDFSKFYDNILHATAKQQLLELVGEDEFVEWLLDLIFESFEIDVTDMSSDEVDNVTNGVFNKLLYTPPRLHSPNRKTVAKSVNIGDQLAQAIGIYYPHKLDNYIKIVRSEKYYGRYMDDWYILHPDKQHLREMLDDISDIAHELGLHINHNKTRIVPLNREFSYLQFRYKLSKSGKLSKRINPRRVVSMRRHLKKLAQKVFDDIIDYDDVEQMFRSWVGSFYRVMSDQQLENLFELYKELFNKDVYIHNGVLYIEGVSYECAV